MSVLVFNTIILFKKSDAIKTNNKVSTKKGKSYLSTHQNSRQSMLLYNKSSKILIKISNNDWENNIFKWHTLSNKFNVFLLGDLISKFEFTCPIYFSHIPVKRRY